MSIFWTDLSSTPLVCQGAGYCPGGGAGGNVSSSLPPPVLHTYLSLAPPQTEGPGGASESPQAEIRCYLGG